MSIQTIRIRFRQDREDRGQLEVPVSRVVWGFAVRVYYDLGFELKGLDKLRPVLYFSRQTEAPFAKPPADRSKNAWPWTLTLAPNPRYPVIEARIETRDAVLHSGFYRLEDVMTTEACYFLKEAKEKGQLDLSPGAYTYEVDLLPEDDLRAFSQDSFEIPRDDGSELLEFEALAEQPRARTPQAKPLFQVSGPAKPGAIRLSPSTWSALTQTLDMPLNEERGGYLVGSVTDTENDAPTVTVMHAVPATQALADAHQFVMSPESGSEIRTRMDREWPELELVGWYHSHIFAPSNAHLGGLSKTDENTHDAHFTQPWQLAALVNIWRDNGTVHRQLRVYRREGAGKKLVESTYDVIREVTPS